MKTLFTMLMLVMVARTSAQELFVVTEPASNAPAKSLGIRFTNSFSKVDSQGTVSYHLMPEIKIGISKKLMFSIMGVGSNRTGRLAAEGLNLYGKYRFLSKDEFQKHFRMALFARYSYNNTPVHMHEINLQAHNSGYEWGVVATQLLHKVALSASGAYGKATNNGKNKFLYTGLDKVFNYTLSAGKLMLPAQYRDYQQTNLNLMVEVLGQINLGDGRYYTDIVPSVQLIINSQSRLDLAWRKQISGSLHRSSGELFMVRFEHNFFNLFK
ncbi:MAG: hypothetical protein JNM68_10350 [Dinghuibacter sp.]|nr:hypothetical protein [Dinghuibacter sp.]